MDNVTIQIIFKRGTLTVVPSHPLHFDELLTVLVNAIKAMAMQLIKSAPEGSKAVARGTLFDLLNLAFSRTLEEIDPTCQTQTTLTEKAIREAEDKIITEGRLDDVTPGS